MGTRRSSWTARRSYHRLGASPTRQAAAPARPAPRWRIRLRRPRLRLLRRALGAPFRALARIRDAYVRMMMRAAGSTALGGGYGYGGGYSLGPAPKEYGEKVLVEIYRSLVAKGHILVSTSKDGVPTAQIVPTRRQNQVSTLSYRVPPL